MTDVTPATQFWDGYTRSPEVAEQLIAAIRDALYAFPTQRLGQIIDNALGIRLEEHDLFQVYDEATISNLRVYIEEHANG
jgi:hypothetical protein